MKRIKQLGLLLAAALLLPAACASSRPGRPADPELYRISRSARAAFDRGEFKPAVRLYRMARQRARLIDDPAELGTVTYNLAAAYLELGETGRADQLLREARRAFFRGPGVPEDLILLQGRIALLEGRTGEAERLIEEGLAEGEKNLDRETRVQFRLLRGRTALAGGDPAAARAAVEESRRPLRKVSSEIILADHAALEGEVLSLEGEHLAAGELFDRAAELLGQAGRYRGMTRARARAGRAYLEAGEFCAAGGRFYRAARSLAARGETVAALELIGAAVGAAEECPEEILREEVGDLFSELERALDLPFPPDKSE